MCVCVSVSVSVSVSVCMSVYLCARACVYERVRKRERMCVCGWQGGGVRRVCVRRQCVHARVCVGETKTQRECVCVYGMCVCANVYACLCAHMSRNLRK